MLYEVITMMYLTPLEGRGLLILPYHRVIQDIKSFRFDEFERKLQDYFEVMRIPINTEHQDASWATFMEQVREAGRKRPSFGMYGLQQNCYHLLMIKEGVFSSLGDDDA